MQTSPLCVKCDALIEPPCVKWKHTSSPPFQRGNKRGILLFVIPTVVEESRSRKATDKERYEISPLTAFGRNDMI